LAVGDIASAAIDAQQIKKTHFKQELAVTGRKVVRRIVADD
jgi:hypothetical protein